MAASVPVPGRTATSDSQQSHYTSDDYMEDDGDAFDGEDDGTTTSVQPEVIILSGLDVAREQEQQISSIASLFECSKLDASIMLRKFAWRTERLIERFFEDPVAIRQQAGLVCESPSKRHRSADEPSSSSGGLPDAGEDELCCGVCFCPAPRDERSALRCGHVFCNDCWTSHLRVQVNDGNADKVHCMAEGCTVLVEPHLAQALLDAEAYAKFARFAQKQFVDDNPYLKWCPAVGCEKVIKVSDIGSCSETACTCGMLFCFACSREAHFPLSCATLTRWEDKNASDSSTGQWFQAHAKRCRKCHSFIEKNGGCNWIRCRCGHEFCYFCFSTDHAHHNQPCNAPPPPEADGAKTDLEYYMHYFDRWTGHRKSQELEEQLRRDAETKMEAMMADTAKKWMRVEVEYLREAVETLIRCRRLLKNTYPFAFYMPRSNQKMIFEELQGRLESRTEALAGLLEAEGEPDRQVVINTRADANKQLANMRELLESKGEPETWTDSK